MSGLLAIDVNNTRSSLALWVAEAAVHHWAIATERRRTADEYRLLLAGLLAQAERSRADVRAVVVGCVVPDLTPLVATACQELFDAIPLIVGPGVHSGLRITTDDPREVGPDRIANGVAAAARYGSPVIVLDFATALTIDVIGPGDEYLGAIITPGMALAADALAGRTARLQRFELVAPPTAIANDTERALQSGIVLGTVGLIEGLVRRIRAEVADGPVVATGDTAAMGTLAPLTRVIDHYDPLLTLDGLRLVYERHTARRSSR
jgi:type III pantothenate kinase